MKTIGLLGGMSWESTALYYQLINEQVKARLGGHHSARLVIVSVDFEEIKALQFAGKWDEAGQRLSEAAQQVERAGADFLLLCTNTMHIVAPQIEKAIDIPFIHLAYATAQAIRNKGLNKVGLLGTRFTMTEDFYKGRLTHEHHLEVIIPSPADQDIVHQVIYDELCHGVAREESRQEYLRIIDDLRARGAQGVIEGCTEIGMLIEQKHTDMPLFDTTAIHATQAVNLALADD